MSSRSCDWPLGTSGLFASVCIWSTDLLNHIGLFARASNACTAVNERKESGTTYWDMLMLHLDSLSNTSSTYTNLIFYFSLIIIPLPLPCLLCLGHGLPLFTETPLEAIRFAVIAKKAVFVPIVLLWPKVQCLSKISSSGAPAHHLAANLVQILKTLMYLIWSKRHPSVHIQTLNWDIKTVLSIVLSLLGWNHF